MTTTIFNNYELDLLSRVNKGEELHLSVEIERLFEMERNGLLLLQPLDSVTPKVVLTPLGEAAMLNAQKEQANRFVIEWEEDQWCSAQSITASEYWLEMNLPHLNEYVVEQAKAAEAKTEREKERFQQAKESNRVKTWAKVIIGTPDSAQAELNEIISRKECEYVGHSQTFAEGCLAITLIYKAKSEVK